MLSLVSFTFSVYVVVVCVCVFFIVVVIDVRGNIKSVLFFFHFILFFMF